MRLAVTGRYAVVYGVVVVRSGTELGKIVYIA